MSVGRISRLARRESRHDDPPRFAVSGVTRGTRRARTPHRENRVLAGGDAGAPDRGMGAAAQHDAARGHRLRPRAPAIARGGACAGRGGQGGRAAAARRMDAARRRRRRDPRRHEQQLDDVVRRPARLRRPAHRRHAGVHRRVADPVRVDAGRRRRSPGAVRLRPAIGAGARARPVRPRRRGGRDARRPRSHPARRGVVLRGRRRARGAARVAGCGHPRHRPPRPRPCRRRRQAAPAEST